MSGENASKGRPAARRADIEFEAKGGSNIFGRVNDSWDSPPVPVILKMP